MSYHLVAGGYRESFALLSFDPSTAKLKVESEPPSPKNASWIEPSSTKSQGTQKVMYSLSEEPDGKVVVSLTLEGKDVNITEKRATHGVPAHGTYSALPSHC